MKISKKLTAALDMPQEVMLDYPRITVMGEESVVVENHTGLIEFSQTAIRLNTKLYLLKISGENLDIKSISQDDVEIVGKITGVTMS